MSQTRLICPGCGFVQIHCQCKVPTPTAPTDAELVAWLDAKWKRHGEHEDLLCRDRLTALLAENARLGNSLAESLSTLDAWRANSDGYRNRLTAADAVLRELVACWQWSEGFKARYGLQVLPPKSHFDRLFAAEESALRLMNAAYTSATPSKDAT